MTIHTPLMTNELQDLTTAASPLTTYVGSCHCGAARFEVQVDLRVGLGKCNCSICKVTNFLGARVKPENFKRLSATEAFTDYQFNSKSVHHYFCARCGVQLFRHANIPQAGGEYYSVNAHALHGADVTGVAVKYRDGLHDNWWNDAPAFA
jgi:hypothetical protein